MVKIREALSIANQMKQEGQSTDDALIHANNARLRPILMTTIAMVIGMLPIAFASGGVGAVKHGMAWVIIGGLISSMFPFPIYTKTMSSFLNIT